jgi:hypothetical protein
MDGLRQFLSDLKRHGYAQGNFLGLLNILVGRRVKTRSGTVVSEGLTWRAAAETLKRLRWDKEGVRELGLDPTLLPPRDRLRFWYLAISHAKIDSPEAMQAGERLAELLRSAGYEVERGPPATPVS